MQFRILIKRIEKTRRNLFRYTYTRNTISSESKPTPFKRKTVKLVPEVAIPVYNVKYRTK